MRKKRSSWPSRWSQTIAVHLGSPYFNPLACSIISRDFLIKSQSHAVPISTRMDIAESSVIFCEVCDNHVEVIESTSFHPSKSFVTVFAKFLVKCRVDVYYTCPSKTLRSRCKVAITITSSSSSSPCRWLSQQLVKCSSKHETS